MHPAIRRALAALPVLLTVAALAGPAAAQIAPQRTWPELKDAVMDRVNRQAYPLTNFKPEDVREIVDRIGSLDRDEWARSWMQTGERYLKEAQAAEKTDPRRAREAYLAAWRYFSFGAWPTQNAPEKKRSHHRAVETFQAYAKIADPPVEVVRIPFEGKEIVGYLQAPPGAARPMPLVISVGGLDSAKEYIVEQYGPGYLGAGLPYLALDMPGTGDAPLKIDVGTERIFTRVLDHLQTRRDVDPKRIGFQGVSWGGHWASRMSYLEKDRLRAVVNWAGPVHGYFQKAWQEKALGTREYLFDLFAARAGVYGVSTLEEFYAYGPRMSLLQAGMLSKPSAPTLLVNGEKDTQVPIEDLYLVLRSGSPKEAWVNPEGGHIGRGPGWSDKRIFAEVVVPWFARNLGAGK